MAQAFEEQGPQLTTNTIQDVNTICNTTAVRDFAYTNSEIFNAAPPATENAAGTPFPNSVTGRASNEVLTPLTGTEDTNKLPYATFYDASWTLSAPTTKFVCKLASSPPAIILQPLNSSADAPIRSSPRRISDRSLTSEYSQYSTYSTETSMYQPGLYGISRVPMQILESEIETDTEEKQSQDKVGRFLKQHRQARHNRKRSDSMGPSTDRHQSRGCA